MNEADLLTIVKDAGIVGVLFIFIIGGVKKWWVWGWQYREYREYAEAEIKYWRSATFRSLNVSEHVAHNGPPGRGHDE